MLVIIAGGIAENFFIQVAAEKHLILELLHEVINDDPDNHLALNFLGYTLAELGRDFDKAESYLIRAIELEPNQGSYLDSLGWIYFKMGELEKAESNLIRAATTKYKSAEVREHMGYLYLEFGRDDKALTEFEAAIANDLADIKMTEPVEKLIKDLRKKLGIK